MFDGFYRHPPGYENIRRATAELRSKYPFLKVFPIGKSVLGRGIFAFGFGQLRRGTLFVGGVHGMEWLTSLLLFRFTEDLCRCLQTGCQLADIDVARSLENHALIIVPCLNPDGVEISLHGCKSAKHLAPFVEKASSGDTLHWQANARGIDLNHNFDAGFAQLKKLERQQGYLTPSPTRFGGTHPHSEPESRALVRLCEAFLPHQAYAYHSQGEEIYYKYGCRTPPRAALMAQMLASASGYRVASPEGIASHGGFKDWFIERYGKPGFTIEIGRGKNPLPVVELEPIYARLVEMLLLAVLM